MGGGVEGADGARMDDGAADRRGHLDRWAALPSAKGWLVSNWRLSAHEARGEDDNQDGGAEHHGLPARSAEGLQSPGERSGALASRHVWTYRIQGRSGPGERHGEEADRGEVRESDRRSR